MWIPKTEEAIVQAVSIGDLQETATFDAKRELPGKNKNVELAIDVAAMANEGGVLLYGVGQDENRQLTQLTPIVLAGAGERVTSIVRTSLAEAPLIEVHEVRTAQNPALGYLVVAVPQSPRAPHMVIVKDEYRYYGRSATGNVPLTEGEVARLYQRRQQWERDLNELVAKERQRLAHQSYGDYGYLYVFAWPVTSQRNLLEQARGDSPNDQTVAAQSLWAASEHEVFRRGLYMPDFHKNSRWARHADGWRTHLRDEPHNVHYPGDILDVQVNFNGSGWLASGLAVERRREGQDSHGKLLLDEELVAGLTTRFVKMMGIIYERAGYVGQVDLAVVVTNLQDATSKQLYNPFIVNPNRPLPPFSQPEYQNTTRVSAQIMGDDSKVVAQELVKPLIDAVTQERHNPFA